MLGWTPGPDHAFLFYGIDQGVFDSLGVTVEWLPTRGSSIVATGLANRTVDFGFLSGDYVVVSKSNKFPITAVATVYHETAVTIYSLKNKNITHPDSLRNKRLGVLTKSAAYPQVISFLKRFNLTPGDFDEIPSRGSITELTTGQADAAMHYSNYGPPTMLAQNIDVNEILLKDYDVDLYGTTLVANNDFLKENKELSEKFILGVLKSLELARHRHEEVLSVLLKTDPVLDSLEMEIALKKTENMIYSGFYDSLGPGYMTKEGWETTIKTTKGFTDGIDVIVDSLYTDKFTTKFKAKSM